MIAARRIVDRATRRLGWSIERYPPRSGLAFHLVQVLALYGVDCVLDVGANRGQFGSMLREAGYAGRIVSFEPVAESFDQLERRAAADPHWQTHMLALADRSGRLPLNVAASRSVSSFLEPTDEYVSGYSGGRIERVEEVRVERLDSIAQSLDFETGFLKTDTQGYDLLVIQGADDCLERLAGIQLEMSVIPIYAGMASYVEALEFMRSLGFTPSGIWPVVLDERLRAYEFDGVFVRA